MTAPAGAVVFDLFGTLVPDLSHGALGMRAVLIRVAYDEATDADRPEMPTWKGLELQALTDVLAMADGGCP